MTKTLGEFMECKIDSVQESRAFLQGLDNQTYQNDATSVTSDVGVVTFTSQALIHATIMEFILHHIKHQLELFLTLYLQSYNLKIGLNIFNPVGTYNPGAIYNHIATGSTNITGSLLALGLTRTPDVRVTGLSLLSYYQPRLYASEYTAEGTSRLVILQLGMVGSG